MNYITVCVSRLQHYESSRGQRESAVHQWAPLSRSGCGKPWRGAGTGHTTPDRCTAQPQALPTPAHAHAPPAAHAHTPPAGGSHRSQRGRRVLNPKPHPQSSPFFNATSLRGLPSSSTSTLSPEAGRCALLREQREKRDGAEASWGNPPVMRKVFFLILNSWTWTFNGAEAQICTCFKCHNTSQKKNKHFFKEKKSSRKEYFFTIYLTGIKVGTYKRSKLVTWWSVHH